MATTFFTVRLVAPRPSFWPNPMLTTADTELIRLPIVNGADADPRQPEPEPAARAFADFLSADPTPRRVHFTVGGEECWIDLLPMDAEAADRFTTLGVGYSMVAGNMQTSGDIDLAARNLFLVVHTVADYCLIRHQRTKEGGTQAYEIRPPQGKGAAWRARLEAEIKTYFRRDPAFWRFVVGECQRENAEDEETAGN